MMAEVRADSGQTLVDLSHKQYQEGNYDKAKEYCMMRNEGEENEEKFLLLLSSIHIQLEQVNDAEMYARKATIINSSPSTESLHQLGKVLRAKGLLQDAIAQFEKAVEIDPYFEEGYESIAMTWLEDGDVEKAILTYEQVLDDYPQLHYIRNHLGTILKEVGRNQEAKKCFTIILEEEQNFVSAWNNLGCIYHLDGEHELAINHFEKAVSISPTYAEGWINLANISKGCNLVGKAKAAYEKALHLLPNDAFVVASLASTYYEEGNVSGAIELYKKSMELEPNYPNAQCNLANIFKDLGLYEEAEKYYKLALSHDSSHITSLNNLANIMRNKSDLQEAIHLYSLALECNPDFVIAHTNIASVYKIQGNLEKSLAHYQEAVRLNPNSWETYAHMGNVLKEMFYTDAANTCYETAITLNPMYPEPYCFKANILKEHGKFLEAIDLYKYVLQLDPEHHEAFCNMMYCQLQICDWSNYQQNISRVYAITVHQIRNDLYPSVHPHHSMLYPTTFYYHKLIAEKYAKFCINRVQPNLKTSYNFERTLYGRLKIGYVSSDFGNHPTSHLMQSLPGLHNKFSYEVFCYALSPHDGSSFRDKLANESEHFVDLSHIKCHVTIADIVHKDGIHILVNMNGYTRGAMNEIFALRPAPIQVMWLGYPGTSGASFIDYLVTDSVASPLEYAQSYSESLAHMPHSFFIGDHKQMFPHLMKRFIIQGSSPPDSPYVRDNIALINTLNTDYLAEQYKIIKITENLDDSQPIRIKKNIVNISLRTLKIMVEKEQIETRVRGLTVDNGLKLGILDPKIATGEKVPMNIIYTSRQQYGLPDNAIVYCNFNQMYKMEPRIFQLWISILMQVPNSVLWLLRFPKDGETNILERAMELGLEGHRIIFSDVVSKEEHVRRGQLADVCLDTTVCNGHTTTMDILWTGTPVVTWPIETMASRIAASQLSAINCQELIASNPEHYIQIAVKLGTDFNYLNLIRAKVAHGRNNHSLFNCYKFVRNIEYLYVKMWFQYSKGLRSDHITHK